MAVIVRAEHDPIDVMREIALDVQPSRAVPGTGTSVMSSQYAVSSPPIHTICPRTRGRQVDGRRDRIADRDPLQAPRAAAACARSYFGKP